MDNFKTQVLLNPPNASLIGVGDVDGPSSSTDNAIVRFDGTTGKLIQNSTVIMTDNGDVSMPSTATLGIQLYNTADQVTNYERLEALYSGNIAFLRSTAGGTGVVRTLSVGTASANISIRNAGSTSGIFQFTTPATGTAGSIGVAMGIGSNTATSGTNIGLSLTPTYNQASGTAANDDLKIARTEQALGSGVQNFINCLGGAAGTTQRAALNSLGYLALGSVTPTLTTALHTPAATTGISSVRLPHGTAPSAPVDGDMWTTTAGLFVRINGATVGPLS